MSGHATMLRAFFSTLSILLRCCVFTRVRLYGHDSVLDSVYWIRLIASIVLIYKKKKKRSTLNVSWKTNISPMLPLLNEKQAVLVLH